MTPKRLLISFALIMLGSALLIGISQAQAPDKKGKPLFVESPSSGQSAVTAQGVGRSRTVEVAFANLNLTGAEADEAVLLNLFDDTVYTAIPDKIVKNPSGSVTWLGRLQDVPYSQVVLVVKDGLMQGNITHAGGSYHIRYLTEGAHRISQVDEGATAQFEAEAGPDYITPQLLPLAAKVADDEPNVEDGSVIDLLVVYTPAARDKKGGVAAIETLAELYVNLTNQSLQNSAIITSTINLIHVAQINYSGSGSLHTDLGRLYEPGDGYVDEAHSLRETYKADLVSLFVADGGYTCGIAYLYFPQNSFSVRQEYGFSVVSMNDQGCSDFTFAHEIGHNMGAQHDWYVDPDIAYFSYSKGYVNRSARWRTIMAYGHHCWDQNFNCPRIWYYSNPTLSYNGLPIGVPEGTSTACQYKNINNPPCDAYNAKVFRNTVRAISNFRIRNTDIGLRKTVSAQTATGGDTLSYTIQLTNTGTTPIVDMVISDFPPPETTLKSASLSADGIVFGAIRWQIEELLPGQSILRTYQVTVKNNLPAQTIIASVAKAQGANAPLTYSNVVETALSGPAFAATLRPQFQPIQGEHNSITYTLSLKNTGDQPASGVEVSVHIPAETDYINNSASNGGTEDEPGRLSWSIGGLSADQTITRAFRVSVTTPLTAGKRLTNTLSATSTEGTGINALAIAEIVEAKQVFLPLVVGGKGGNTANPVIPQYGKKIAGRVSVANAFYRDATVKLRYFDGVAWRSALTLTTNSQGEYEFTGLPELSGDQKYYVRWDNEYNFSAAYDYVDFWHCDNITAATPVNSSAYQCSFNVFDVTLLSPDSPADVLLPATFTWEKRAPVTDSYQFVLVDFSNVWESGPLGYVDSYTLTTLPSGFSVGELYSWLIRIYGTNGYGQSQWGRSIRFE